MNAFRHTQNGDVVQRAITSSVESVRTDFRDLHARQKAMLEALENDFLHALPEKMRQISVSDFLNKHEASLSHILTEQHTYHHNLQSNILHQSVKQPLNQHMQTQSSTAINPFISSAQSKSILKNSKRKRDEAMQQNTNKPYQQQQQQPYIPASNSSTASTLPWMMNTSNTFSQTYHQSNKENNNNGNSIIIAGAASGSKYKRQHSASASKSSKKKWRF